ncbi:MAG: amidohydrolase, partial [Saprospiraceae bacterium]|nr:amidohydrolase [Saprospiraceae bacterium]
MRQYLFTIAVCCVLIQGQLLSQIEPAPVRKEGEGPFERLILRGATVINSTGAPPVGPVDIVIEKNVIKQIRSVGYPGATIQESDRPKAKPGDKELDCSGMYILPGFVDMHGHIGGQSQGTPSEYVFKLWLAHGITTIRDPASGNGVNWTLEHKKKSAANEIAAPRILCYPTF